MCRVEPWIALPLVALLTLAVCKDAAARILNLRRISGAVGVGAEAALQQVEGPNAPKREFERYRFDERIELAFDGSLVTPELLTFRLGGGFGLRQELLSGPAGSGDLFTRLLTYDAILNFLPQKRVSLLLFGSRFEDNLIQNFGTDTESKGETLGANLRFLNPWFPSNIIWQQLKSSNRTVGGLTFSRRADTRQLIEYSGRHHSPELQASLRLRLEDVDDDSIPAVGDYRVWQGNGFLSYRWGPYFEKFWRTRAHFMRREGRFDFQNGNLNSGFFWDPTETLSTRFEYDFNYVESETQRSFTHTGRFSAGHALWQSLVTNFSASINRSDLSIGTASNYATNLLLNFRKNLPWSSRLLMDLRLRYRIEDRDFDSTRIEVPNEHVPVETGRDSLLENPNIDESTVRVFEVEDGARGRELLPSEFSLRPEGDRLFIAVFITLPLEGGEVIASYFYEEPDPSATTGRFGFGAGVGWDFGWFSIGYNHDEIQENLLAGDPETRLDDSQRDSFRVDLNARRGAWSASAAGVYLRNRPSTLSGYDEMAFNQDLIWNPSPALQLGAHLRESWQWFQTLDRNTRSIVASASLYWRFRGTWNLRAFADFRDRVDSVSLDQRDVRMGMRLHFDFGKIEIDPVLVWTRRQRGPSLSNDLRAVLRLRRRF